jgi:ectoine hydroxylase-related dioxygenase (phytanoyl-CoA dioxygenase family)
MGETMDEYERYLFDLEGYLVLRGVLDKRQLAEVNACVDRAGIPAVLTRTSYVHTGFPEQAMENSDPAEGPVDIYTSLLTDWGREIRDLIGLKPIMPYLTALLGPALRLDHCYGIFMQGEAGKGTPHTLHNGGTPFDPSQYYLVRDGRMYNGLLGVSFALTDVPPGTGGFCVIPGSHKSNFPVPPDVASIMDETHPVRHVPLTAGDAVIFTEAVTHGSLPWSGRGERRALLFKYAPGHLQWEQLSPMVNPSHDWSDEQRRLISPPYFGGRPAVAS